MSIAHHVWEIEVRPLVRLVDWIRASGFDGKSALNREWEDNYGRS
jgi:hypothetical protein